MSSRAMRWKRPDRFLQSETVTMFMATALLILLAFGFKVFLPRNSIGRYPGGWPIGWRYYRGDTFFFRIFFGLGILVAVIASFRGLLK